MRVSAPILTKRTNIGFDKRDLESGPCGLFRAPLREAANLMPTMRELVESVPEFCLKDDWELDIKVHMLMPGQWPCIPNWHTDNVPRDENGLIDYGRANRDNPPMFLWVSNAPATEFLDGSYTLPRTPQSHGDLAQMIRDASLGRRQITPNAWYQMDQFTPHRGVAATEHTWRVFARLTHKTCLPDRPVVDVIRRHAQVYLDAAAFTW